MYKFSEASKANLENVHSALQDVCNLALKLSVIDFGIPSTGGFRTAETQLKLFNAGKSQLDGVGKVSMHQRGLALDFYAYVDGKASWDKLHLALVANAFMQAAARLGFVLTWGGLWRQFPDYPHIQLETSWIR